MTKKTFLFVCLLSSFAPGTHADNLTIPLECTIMKKFILIIVCCSSFYRVQSQEYIPLVTDGKIWNMELCSTWESWPDYGVVRNEKWELKGDTIIGKLIYKKYFKNGVYQGAMREEDKRVFYHFRDDDHEYLLYDFGLKKGDRIVFNRTDYEMTDENYVKSGNKPLRRMKLVAVSDPRDTNYWIEGIGALEGPCNPFYSMRTGGVDISISSCYVNNQCIYEKLSNGIQQHSLNVNSSAAIYDLQGRKLKKLPEKGLYIKNGKLKTR